MKTKQIEVNVVNDECDCPVCDFQWYLEPTDLGIECDCGVWLIVKTRSLV